MAFSQGDRGVQVMCAGVQAGDRDLFEVAGELFEAALKESKRNGDAEEESRVLGNMGMLQWNLGDLEAKGSAKRDELRAKATKLVKEALAVAESNDDEWGQANQHSDLGVFCEDLHDKAGATRHWKKARDLYDLDGMADEARKMQRWIQGLG